MLGLSGDPARFEAQVSGSSDLAPLIAGQRGLTVPLVAQPFDGLVWAIAGQQVRLPVAFAMRRRLVERAGTQVAPGLFLPPGAADVAALEADELARMGFTRSRSRYLANAARQVADGQLPLEEMGDASATRIERRLRDLPGIGPWSAGYVLMRSFGFQNAVPVGDSVLAHGLQQFFRLEGRPCADEMMRLMDRFSPYRSLATFHIWQRFGRAA